MTKVKFFCAFSNYKSGQEVVFADHLANSLMRNGFCELAEGDSKGVEVKFKMAWNYIKKDQVARYPNQIASQLASSGYAMLNEPEDDAGPSLLF